MFTRYRRRISQRRASDPRPAPATPTPWAQSPERDSVRDAAHQRALRQRPS